MTSDPFDPFEPKEQTKASAVRPATGTTRAPLRHHAGSVPPPPVAPSPVASTPPAATPLASAATVSDGSASARDGIARAGSDAARKLRKTRTHATPAKAPVRPSGAGAMASP